MASEYETLVEKLKATGIPFAEYGWKTRPEGTYGVITPDMEAGSANGDGEKLDRAWDTSVDLFFPRLADRKALTRAVETAMKEVCGDSWSVNSIQYEQQTGLFHVEWICEVIGELDGEEETEAGGT